VLYDFFNFQLIIMALALNGQNLAFIEDIHYNESAIVTPGNNFISDFSVKSQHLRQTVIVI